MVQHVFSSKLCRQRFCQTPELFCSCSGSCRGTYQQRILLLDQLACAIRFIIQSLEPVGKSWMGEFQLASILCCYVQAQAIQKASENLTPKLSTPLKPATAAVFRTASIYGT